LRVLAAVRDFRLLAQISQLTLAIGLRLFSYLVLPNPLPTRTAARNSYTRVRLSARAPRVLHLQRVTSEEATAESDLAAEDRKPVAENHNFEFLELL
jgi:hypothetical protein